jgi:autotransporter-associated beta strand protein
MRKFIGCFIAVVALSLWSSSASAALNVYDPFNYSPGALLGNTNNSGVGTANGNIWLNAGVGAVGEIVTTASLTSPAGVPVPVGNELSVTNILSGNPTNRLALDQNYTAAGGLTLYFSMLLNVTDLTNSNNTTGGFFFSFNNTGNSAQGNDPTVMPGRLQVRIDPNDGTKYNLGYFGQSGATAGSSAWATNQLDTNVTQFIAGSINLGTREHKLWINPDPSTFSLATAPAATSSLADGGTWSGNNIQSLLIRQTAALPNLIMDELRVGSAWADVTPTLSVYWDIDGATAGAGGGGSPSGTWDGSAANWNRSPAGDAATEVFPNSTFKAVFTAGDSGTGGATGAYTITVDGTRSAKELTFEDGAPTLTGGTVDVNGGNINVNPGVTAIIESNLSGSLGMNKTLTGTAVLTSNSNSYSGTTTVTAGTLQIGNGGTTGKLPTASAIVNNGTLTFNRSNLVEQGVDFSGAAITGTGGMTQAGSGTLELTVANTFSGTTRAAAGTVLVSHSQALQNSIVELVTVNTGVVVVDSSLTSATYGALSGTTTPTHLALINASSAPLALSVGNNNGVYAGNLSGAGSLTKIGTGAQVLSGTNTYTGITNINAGTLQYGTTASMPATVSTAAGDHNGNGTVDAADYVTWRTNPGAFGGGLGYTTWRSNFGNTAQGLVTVNNGGTLGVNAGGAGEWTDSTDTSTGGTIGSLIAGRGGQGAANQITWMPGSVLGIDTTNAPGAPTAPALTYAGVIGGFRTAGGGTTDAVGFTKRGLGTLTLSADSPFSGPLSVTGGVSGTEISTLVLNGTALNAGNTMAIPIITIASNSILELGASDRLNPASVITTDAAGRLRLFGNTQTIRSLSALRGVIEVGTGTLIIADQAGDDYTYGTSGGAVVDSPGGGTIRKTGAGTLTLAGAAVAGGNVPNGWHGNFILENGRLNLENGSALGSNATLGTLTVEGGVVGRNSTSGNFTYQVAFADLHVLRYDLSAAPGATAQFSAGTTTTLREDNVEIEIINTGLQTPSSGRFIFLGDIRNHDPFTEDGSQIRGITKTGNGVLGFGGTGGNGVTSYKGPTTIEEGTLLVIATSTLGDYTQPPASIGTLYLKGGALATTTTRTTAIMNPVEVDGSAALSHFSTAASPSGVAVMEFSSDSVVGTSGTLTIKNENSNSNTASVFQPRFTGSGFDFDLPIILEDPHSVGTGVKSVELQGGNTTGVQTFSGVISGGGGIRRVNAGGTTVLTGANTYSGGTAIDGGTLLVNNASGSGTGTGAVVVNTGGTLGGTGSLSGAVTLNTGGTIAPGTSIDSLDLGALAVSGGTLSFELGAPSTSDLLNVTGADSLTITSGLVDLIDAGGLGAGTYTLIDYSGTPLTNATVDLLSFQNTPGGFNYDLVDNATNTTIDLVVTTLGSGTGGAVPEPGSVLLAAMALCWALGGCNGRSRRRKG